MPAPHDVMSGEELLVAVSDTMVEFHRSFHGRPPVIGKALLFGEQLLVCVLGEVYGDVARTMIDVQATTVVQQTRSAFQEEMQDRFIASVQRLSGRDVQAFISNSRVDPDVEIELFMLRPRRGERTPPRMGVGRGYAYAWERPRAV